MILYCVVQFSRMELIRPNVNFTYLSLVVQQIIITNSRYMTHIFQCRYFDCVELQYDAGDCVSCPNEETYDCNGKCFPTEWLGDGTCHNANLNYNSNLIQLDCLSFDFDNGDCSVDFDGDGIFSQFDCDDSDDTFLELDAEDPFTPDLYDPSLHKSAYVNRNGKVHSEPVATEQLKKLFQGGKLLPTDKLSKSPDGPWTAVSDLSLH